MRRIILMAIVALLFCAGCKDKSPEPKAEPVKIGNALPSQSALPREDLVKKLVERYNVLLAGGYKSLDMNPLQEVATPQQAEKAYIHMAAIGEGTVRMISQLKKLDFVLIQFPTDKSAIVRTHEVWDFAYTDIKSGKKNEEVKDFPYDVTYTFEQSGGRWLISDIVASSEKDAEANMPKKSGLTKPGGHP
jgi:hypothetical protein